VLRRHVKRPPIVQSFATQALPPTLADLPRLPTRQSVTRGWGPTVELVANVARLYRGRPRRPRHQRAIHISLHRSERIATDNTTVAVTCAAATSPGSDPARTGFATRWSARRHLHRPCRARPADPVPGRGGPERRGRPRPNGTGKSDSRTARPRSPSPAMSPTLVALGLTLFAFTIDRCRVDRRAVQQPDPITLETPLRPGDT
jgi:hypothetical protein